jgi:ankyrin repeat domain-containing protein 50
MKPSFAMAYYYFDFSDTRKQNVRNMLNSLIAQICHQRRELLEAVTSFYRQYYDGRMVPSISDLTDLLACSTEGFMDVYFVLDALDECPPSGPAATRADVLKTLKAIKGWGDQRIHLLVTSRNEVDIEHELTPIITDGPLDVREFIDEDIKLYIRNELSSPKFQHWSPGIAADVEESLIKRADGM